MNASTVRYFAKSIKFGSKYVYQTIPRLLTIWLDMGEDPKRNSPDGPFKKVNELFSEAVKKTPVYKVRFGLRFQIVLIITCNKWYTAFPQIVSRVGHPNKDVYNVLFSLISNVIKEYPKQALWLFTSVMHSTKRTREQRGRDILEGLKVTSFFTFSLIY